MECLHTSVVRWFVNHVQLKRRVGSVANICTKLSLASLIAYPQHYQINGKSHFFHILSNQLILKIHTPAFFKEGRYYMGLVCKLAMDRD